MDLDETQDIVNAYLKPRSSQEGQQRPFIEEQYDTDPLGDLLNITNLGKLALPSKNSSPFKISGSPLKSRGLRLSRSPVRGPHQSPRKVQDFQYAQKDIDADLEVNFDLDLASLADFEEYGEELVKLSANQNYSYLPDTRYSQFISKSTLKLRQALLAEKRRAKQLEHSKAELELEISRLRRIEGEHNLLKTQMKESEKELEALRAKVKGRGIPEDSVLLHENALLRQKLIKYKNLYENVTNGKKSPDEESEKTKNSLNAPARAVEKRQQAQQPSHGDSVDGNLGQLGPLLVSLLAIFQSIQKRTAQDPETCDRRPKESRPSSSGLGTSESLPGLISHLSNETRSIANEEEPELGANEHEHQWRADVPNHGKDEEKSRPLTHAVDVIDQIRREIHNINLTLRENVSFRPAEERRLDYRSGGDKSSCSACSNAASRLSSRPNTSSTPKENEDGNDATRNLMGKYNWNRTL